MGDKLLKAGELPPGSTMLPRMGTALSGQEVALAVNQVAADLLVELEVEKETVLALLTELDRRMWADTWAKVHLTFPRVVVEVAAARQGDKAAVSVVLDLAHNNKVTLDVGDLIWQAEGSESVRKVAGPSRVPDDLREQLGLPLTAQFRLPTGERVLAELPSGEDTARHRESPQLVSKPVDGHKVPPNPLVGVPPTAAELVGEPVALKAAPQAPQVVAKKHSGGGKR